MDEPDYYGKVRELRDSIQKIEFTRIRKEQEEQLAKKLKAKMSMEAHDRHVRRKLKEIRENSKDSRESIRKAISNLEQMERNITAQAEKTSAFFADLRKQAAEKERRLEEERDEALRACQPFAGGTLSLASFGRSLTYIPPSPSAAGLRSPARRSGSGTPMLVPPPSILSTLENYERFLQTVDSKLAGLVTGTDFGPLGTPQQQYQQQQQLQATGSATGSSLRQSQASPSRQSLTQSTTSINPLLSYTTPPGRSLGGSMPPPASAPTFPLLSGGLLGRSLPVNARSHLTAPLEDLLTTLQAERMFLSTAAAQPVPQMPVASDPAAEALKARDGSKSHSSSSSRSSSSDSSRKSGRHRHSHSHRRHSSEKAAQHSRRHRQRSDSGDEFDTGRKGHRGHSDSRDGHERKHREHKHHSKERRRSGERQERRRSPERQRHDSDERSTLPQRRPQEQQLLMSATTRAAALAPAPLDRWPESRVRLAVAEEPPAPDSARSVTSELSLSGGRRAFEDVTPAAIARKAPSRDSDSYRKLLQGAGGGSDSGAGPSAAAPARREPSPFRNGDRETPTRTRAAEGPAPETPASDADEKARVLAVSLPPTTLATSPAKATAAAPPDTATYANLGAFGSLTAGGSGSGNGVSVGSGAKGSGGGAKRGALSSSSSSEIEEVEDQASEFDLVSDRRGRAGAGAGAGAAAKTSPARASTGTGSSASGSPAKSTDAQRAMPSSFGAGSSIRDAVVRRTDELAEFYDDQ